MGDRRSVGRGRSKSPTHGRPRTTRHRQNHRSQERSTEVTALIEEVVKFDVHCPECGGTSAQFDSRSKAEQAANEHDATWHIPIFEDELEPTA